MSDAMPEFLGACLAYVWPDDICTHDPICDTEDHCERADCHACRPEQDCIEHKAQAREGAAYDTADMNWSDR